MLNSNRGILDKKKDFFFSSEENFHRTGTMGNAGFRAKSNEKFMMEINETNIHLDHL